MFAQQLVSGVAAGSLYSLLAVGLVLIHKATGLPNFAQGEMAMVSTYAAFTLVNRGHWPLWASILGALLIAALLGLLIDRMVVRHLLHAPVLSAVIATLGLGTAFNSGAGLLWGRTAESFPSLFAGNPIHFRGLVVSLEHVGIIAMTLVLVTALSFFFRYTRLGKAMRATAQSATMARLMGVRIKQVYSLTWMVASVAGAIAGILFAPVTYLEPNFMETFVVKAFSAAILGGMDSIAGALLGGVLLGVAENLASIYVSAQFRDVLAFLVIIAVLLFRPQGILSHPMPRKL